MSGQTEKEIVIFITAPNEDEAARIARSLVEARLAACANIVRGIRSIYAWQGKIQDDSEVLMIVKTRKGLFNAVSDKVKELHSYDVPEIIALPIIEGAPDYLKWLKESTEQQEA
jgi:periplasmic divalent cation tolerance protein